MRRASAVAALASAAFAAATVALFVVSRGKWSDPLIDSGREWLVPDALSRGELLYRDVVYWFGPFTPYFQALFLRVFGSGFAALVLAGAVAALGTLAILFVVLRRVTGPRDALLWAAFAVPALVFMPNAGGALLGMGYRIWHAAAFALAAVAIASRGSGSRRAAWSMLAGGCAGLAGLCRTEWGLAAVAATVLACLVRPRRRGAGSRDALLVIAGYFVTFGGGLGYFLWKAGPDPVLGDGHVLLTGLPPETRHFLLAFSGLADWKSGALELAYSAAMWTGLFLIVARIAVPAAARRRPGFATSLGVVLAILGATALFGGAGGAVLFSAAPLACLAGLVAGLWRRRGSPAAALAACGALGLSLSYRRLFHIGDSAYVGPPLVFALVCTAGLLRLAVARPVRPARHAAERRRLGAGFRWTVAALVVLAFAGRFWQYASIDAVAIGGADGMLAARSELAREIEQLSAAVRRGTAAGDGLVVLPEGEVLNLLSGRANPIRHKLYLPGYLTDENELAVLEELRRARPAAVVLWRRPTSEYDRGLFGEDYGRRIRSWIDANYRLVPFRETGAPARANPRFLIGLRKDAA